MGARSAERSGASSLHRGQIAGEVTAEKAQVPLISLLSPGIKAKYSSQPNLLLHFSRLIHGRGGDRQPSGGTLSAPLGHPTVNRKISRGEICNPRAPYGESKDLAGKRGEGGNCARGDFGLLTGTYVQAQLAISATDKSVTNT